LTATPVDATPNQPLAAAAELPLVFDLAQQIFDLVDGRQNLSPTKFIEMMGLDLDAFATNAHVHRDTITRSPAAKSIQSFIHTNLQVLAAVMDVSEDGLHAAIFWYRNEPLAVFGHKTAEKLVTEGRAANVVDLLASYQAGFVG
jgi:hypothetical protein